MASDDLVKCTGIPSPNIKYNSTRYYRILFPIMQTVLVIGGIAFVMNRRSLPVKSPFSSS